MFVHSSNLYSNEAGFDDWLNNFKKVSKNFGISDKTINLTFSNIKFLPKVIEYDRYQPEFYEDTFTYVKKRSSNNKIKSGVFLKTSVMAVFPS